VVSPKMKIAMRIISSIRRNTKKGLIAPLDVTSEECLLFIIFASSEDNIDNKWKL
jgi:hypothetical protein